MMISLFPYDGTDAGLGAGQTVTLEVSAVSWRGDYTLSAPPTPPSAAALTDFASHLSACLLLCSLLLFSI